MNLKIRIVNFLSLLFVALGLQVHAQTDMGRSIGLHWQKAPAYDGKSNLGMQLILKNKTGLPVPLAGWDLWFNAIYPVKEVKTASYLLSNENGNLFRIRFLNNPTIAAHDSLTVDFTSAFAITNVSSIPNGFYFQHGVDKQKIADVKDFQATAITANAAEIHAFQAALYDRNAALVKAVDPQLILPSPLAITAGKGSFLLDETISVYIDSAFESKHALMAVIAQNFPALPAKEAQREKAQMQVVYNNDIAEEGYELTISKKGVQINARSDAGLFYALQSIKSLVPALDSKTGKRVMELPSVEVVDAPRFGYRGFMLDIARNFRDKNTIKKYIDAMASYKLNVLHLHFIDDEGWRIAIAALPELTAVGANRSASFADGSAIQPAYGSGAETATAQFLTRNDFVELLKYATDRHITVVPEIETPGHGRAAIKAMENRYHRFMKTGNKLEAERYLLHDFADSSLYNSAQNWNDNVMNVALPSTYSFIATVLDEFKGMYADAGLTLTKVSLGGDEVPNGVWEKSPKIKQLMDSLSLPSVHAVWPYYVQKIQALCKAKGLEMAGWEEFGMVNQGKGMVVNPALSGTSMQLDVWNNVIGGGQEDLAYKLANAGYKTVLISSTNYYFDMAWNTNFMEPGLKWATYADLYHSYTLLPENFFTNMQLTKRGKELGADYFQSKERLTEKGKAHLIGLKGGLWAETVQSEERLDYMVFPRFLALAERAWSPKKTYETDTTFNEAAFNADYHAFVQKIGTDELQKLGRSFRFRLPAVGLKEIAGKLHANIEYPGFDIYYTEDGSVPTLQSKTYTTALDIEPSKVYTFSTLATDGRASLPSAFKK